MKELTIKQLKQKGFSETYELLFDLYKKLFLNTSLTNLEKKKILSLAIVFINSTNKELRQLGYRVALAYGNKTNDYTPLYDIAINYGLLPVTSLIKNIKDLPINSANKASFLSILIEGYIDSFRTNNIIYTEQQLRLNKFFLESLQQSSIIVAPTSYGKSELIVLAISALEHKRICIIVPSKSLLAQTRRRILNANIKWFTRIVSHPEMHKPNNCNTVYVLTQERLSRVLNSDKEMYFDLVFVDEAHNLLTNDDRNILLASTIKVLEYRNGSTAFKFLTPFLVDTASIVIRESAINASSYKIDEYVKSETLFIADYRQVNPTFYFYDHFLDEFISLDNQPNGIIKYIASKAINKNIIYLNKPKDVQYFAKNLASSLPIVNSDLINAAVSEIGKSFHNMYLLLFCLKHGVVYHHGSMTEAVRSYVEYLYTNCNEVKFLVSNSTLLEGVNLPIEKIFLLSISKGRSNLTPSQFRNLIGRINRFSEIFSSPRPEALNKLQPEVHIVASNSYCSSRANLYTFIRKVMHIDSKIEDKIENVLLNNTDLNDDNKESYNQVMTRLENLERGITGGFECQTVTTPAGLKILENNITEINVFATEKAIQTTLDEFELSEGIISDSKSLITVICRSFISFLDHDQNGSQKGLSRLENEKAQAFYAMFIDWKIKKVPLSLMIMNFIEY